MKKIILIIVVSILSLTAYAQNISIFDKFEDYDEVTTVVVNKKMFEMLGSAADSSVEGEEYQNLINGLNGLRVFTTENKKIAGEMQNTFAKYLKSAKLSELMRVKDKDVHVKIYVKEGRDSDHVSEFLMFVDEMNVKAHTDGNHNPEVVIISLTGDINLNNISKITSKMNIPGGEHMKKVDK